MRLTGATAPFSCAALFVISASAHRLCTSCIPLSDLLAEAYGIAVAADRLSSAVAFHNGSMALIGTAVASQAYKDLMQPILTKKTGHEPRKVASRCPLPNARPRPSPFDESFSAFLLACLRWVTRLWQPSADRHLEESTPLHPTTQLIQTPMLALAPFTDRTPKARLPEACHVAAAAESIFGSVRLESAPSSAYSAAGYELCRISYEAFECTGPGRLMTLEYDGDVAVASMVETPLLNWAANQITFSARTGRTFDDMAGWIDAFIDSQRPDMLMLAGSGTEDPVFMTAPAKSRAGLYLHDRASLTPGHILAMGAAQAAKDALETPQVDCAGLRNECYRMKFTDGKTLLPFSDSTLPTRASADVAIGNSAAGGGREAPARPRAVVMAMLGMSCTHAWDEQDGAGRRARDRIARLLGARGTSLRQQTDIDALAPIRRKRECWVRSVGLGMQEIAVRNQSKSAADWDPFVLELLSETRT